MINLPKAKKQFVKEKERKFGKFCEYSILGHRVFKMNLINCWTDMCCSWPPTTKVMAQPPSPHIVLMHKLCPFDQEGESLMHYRKFNVFFLRLCSSGLNPTQVLAIRRELPRKRLIIGT